MLSVGTCTKGEVVVCPRVRVISLLTIGLYWAHGTMFRGNIVSSTYIIYIRLILTLTHHFFLSYRDNIISGVVRWARAPLSRFCSEDDLPHPVAISNERTEFW